MRKKQQKKMPLIEPVSGHPQERELESISVPTLVLIGENERIYSAEKVVKRLRSVAPQIKTEILPNAGHGITVVKAELVYTKVLEFLKKTF